MEKWTFEPEGMEEPGIHTRILSEAGAENFVTICAHHVKGPGMRLIIPEGFRFDFASIPKMARWFISRTDSRIVRAAFVHDWLYANRIETRARADAIFLEIMKENGMPAYKRWTAWLAVRLGGARAWRT